MIVFLNVSLSLQILLPGERRATWLTVAWLADRLSAANDVASLTVRSGVTVASGVSGVSGGGGLTNRLVRAL